MTTFQAVIYAIIHGLTEFWPVGVAAHQTLVSYFLGWPEPPSALLAAMSLGSLLSLLVYFRHDWASMFSSFLQVVFFRKKPMTLDERLPFFLAIATIPTVAAWYYGRELLASLEITPLILAASLAGFALPLAFTDSFSRRTKKLFDWNWLDALLAGITQALGFLPGGGRVTGFWIGAMARNFSREAAAKFMFFASMPLILGSAIVRTREMHFHAATAGPELSWFSFYVALIVTFLAGLLAIGAFLKHTQKRGMGQYVLWRFLMAAAVVAVFWFRNRG